MLRNVSIILLTFLAMNIATVSNAQEAPQLRADNIDQVLNAMTLQEKAQMLVGGGSENFIGTGSLPTSRPTPRRPRQHSR